MSDNLEARIAVLEASVTPMAKDVREIRDALLQARGGLRLVMAMAAVGSFFSAVVGAVVGAFVKVKFFLGA